MKRFFQFIFAIVLLTSSNGSAQPGHSHDKPSVHGMLIVGESKIYLSHLPMFHTPHDYQVIIEAKLSKEGEAAYRSSLAAGGEPVYTLVPEVFVLPDMISNPQPFLAKIYRGHFERGGVAIASGVTVEISNVLYFKKFSPQEAKPEASNYLLFGDGNEQFLAHAIVSKPDFDHVLKVTPTKESIGLLAGQSLVSVSFTNVKNADPIVAPSILSAETTEVVPKLSISIESSIYLEFGDLSF